MRPSAFYIMRTILEKEFRQIFRNPTILRMIIVMPIFQLILIPLAADYEIKNINITRDNIGDFYKPIEWLIGKVNE